MARRRSARNVVRVAENFAHNLESVRRFLEEADALEAYDHLLSKLFEDVIPNLERFPDLGSDLLSRRPQSIEAERLHERLRSWQRRGFAFRQYLFDEYVLLYANRERATYLLALRHHRQLSFDLSGHWSE